MNIVSLVQYYSQAALLRIRHLRFYLLTFCEIKIIVMRYNVAGLTAAARRGRSALRIPARGMLRLQVERWRR